MRKCYGNYAQDVSSDAIFDVKCQLCRYYAEFFQDELTRPVLAAGKTSTVTSETKPVSNGARPLTLVTYAPNSKGQKGTS